ncbi:MAG TPA: hypothetical protein VF648_03090 [Pyrinomonadaceae bacterium]|jgi:hypothetical protein
MYVKRNTRHGLISWKQHQLTLPRFQMSLILLLTGFVGFLSSFLLLHSGISQMWLRYPLAILSAYIAFLLLLRLWLAVQRYQGNFDLPIDGSFSGTSSTSGDFSFGGGGDFAGGGAGGSWGNSVSTSHSDSGGSPIFDGISFDFDLEELGLLILAIVALLGGIVASLYVVYIAPVLLAEILVDGFLLRGLYKRAEHIERMHWLKTAVRKTLLPALLCVLFFGIAGGALQAIAPEAKSIGEVWNVLTTSKSE